MTSFKSLTPLDERLKRENEKLQKINSALMQRVERSMDQQANAFSLFQTAISQDAQIKARTEQLNAVLQNLELANTELRTARDAAERANLFKTRFFTAVGHDLLQPVHAARLTLAELADAQTTPAAQRLSDNISNALSTIEDLLASIMDISKLEAGMFVPNVQAFDLQFLFSGLNASIEPTTRRKGLQLHVRPTRQWVSSDPVMLRRILQNLLANAANYTSSGGILLGARDRGSHIAIDVYDTGPGIGANERDLIFQEFERGSASHRSGGTGFGLGLSIVKRMADALDHDLSFASRLDRGTHFRVRVPKAVPQSIAVTPRKSIALGGELFRCDVIVVDNDLSVLDAMQTLLARWGARVFLARDIDELDDIAEAQEAKPAIILADYHLDHGVVGIDAIRRIRELYGAGLPAILITADRTEATQTAAREHGCEILHKPTAPAELRSLMQYLLSNAAD
jgi:two-component system, sensor histidine kinase